MLAPRVSHSRPMGSIQLLMTPLGIPAQSQHWQASVASNPELNSTAQQQSHQPSVVQSTHGQHPAAHDSRGPSHSARGQRYIPFLSSTFWSCLGFHLTAVVPLSANEPYNRPTPQPSGNPQRPSAAVGKPLHLDALQLGKPLRLPASHSTGRPVYYPLREHFPCPNLMPSF